jgi:hypothetical protein
LIINILALSSTRGITFDNEKTINISFAMSENNPSLGIYQELNKLISTVPPGELKESLGEIFKRSLTTMEKDIDPDQLQKLVTDFYLVYRFLGKMEGMHFPDKGKPE